MKESGINHFFGNVLGLQTGNFKVFYTFEEGAGSLINSVSGGQAQFSGILNTVGSFWQNPGSGYSTGNYVQINNASGLASNFWTKLFVYQKGTEHGGVLFSNLAGASGYEIGLTDSNKLYFKANNIVVNGTVSMSDKNVVGVSYLPNSVLLNYYNFNSQQMEGQAFNYGFELQESDDWKLLPSFTGGIDYFLYFSDYYGSDVLSQLASGFWAYNTGIVYDTQTITQNTITGYQTVTIVQTGVTGYSVNGLGGDGINYYTGEFSTGSNVVPLTGIISSSSFASGVSGQTSYTVTGAASYGYQFLTGYVQSFGMNKIQMILPWLVEPADVIKDSYSLIPWDDNYNKTTFYQYSGFQIGSNQTGFNFYQNGVALSSGWNIVSLYAFFS